MTMIYKAKNVFFRLITLLKKYSGQMNLKGELLKIKNKTEKVNVFAA